MKTSIKWIIGLSAAAVAFIVLACILFFSAINVSDIKSDVLNNGGVIFNEKRVIDISLEENKSVDGIEKIEIEVGSGHVEIIETEGNDLKASINGKYYNVSDSSKGYSLELTSNAKVLSLKIKHDWNFFNIGSFFIGDIIVEIPITFEGDLDLKIGSGSIDVKVDSVDKKFSNFKLTVYSGFADIKKLNAKEADIEVFSGDLEIYDCTIDGNLKLTVHSGYAKIKGEFKTLNATVHSGTADIETTKEIAGNYKIEVHSGSFYLKLPGTLYELVADISSGILKDKAGKWHYDDFETGSGTYKIDITVSSGYAEIN